MRLKIAKLPGDGIGPEVVAQAVKVVDAVCARFGHEVSYTYGYVGACAIDRFGDAYPAETHALCMDSDAVLFGAVVDKSPLKTELVDGADFLCIRELTGGMYFGEKGRKDDGNTAYDTCIYSRAEVERILKLAFEYAGRRRKHLTVVDKANVLESSRLWRQVAQEMAPNYPDIQVDYMFVDNAAMQLIRWPKFFDVLVTENTFGDILTDEASCISGSMGLLASASVGEHTSLFEPIHGSYPQAAGKDIANPVAAILSAAMMFEYAFGLMDEGKAIREAVAASLEAGVTTEDLGGSCSTSAVGDWIASKI